MRRFFTVTLPLLRPSIAYSAGIVALLGVGQFTAPLLLGQREGIDVLTTEIFRLLQHFPIDYGLGAALSSPVLAFGIAIVFLQRAVIGDPRKYVVQTGKATRTKSGKNGWATLPILVYGIVAVLLPILALLHVALSPYWTGRLEFGSLTVQHFQSVLFENNRVRDAILTSIAAAAGAVALVIPIGFFASLVMLRRSKANRVIKALLDGMITLPLAIPTAIFGFAILFAYTAPPFQLYGTFAVVVLAYATLMIPYAVRLQSAALFGLTNDYWSASRVSGAGSVRTLRRIIFPLVRPAMAGAATIMIVLLFHEFTASLMVRSARTQVMGTVLYDFWSGGIYPETAVMALVMIAVTAVGIVVTGILGGRDSLERL